MKRAFTILVALAIGLGAAAQVTVNVAMTDGTERNAIVYSTGEVYINTTSVIVMSSTQSGQTVSFAIDSIAKITFSGSVGIRNVADAAPLTLRPNPATDILTVSGAGMAPQTLTVYNAAGTEVMRSEYTGEMALNVSALPQGIYLMRVGDSFAKFAKQ